jgi:transcriptional regulator with XRE-family HTH domain
MQRQHGLTVKKQRLASLLREVRIEAGLTQTAVAESIGQTQSYVSKYEQGEQRLDLLELEAVCNAVGIQLTEFVRRFVES